MENFITVEREQKEKKAPITQVIPNNSIAYRFLKRTFDIVASLCGLIVLSPVFLITAFAIYIEDPGKTIFVQERNGLNGKVFRMYKFRSMCKDAPKMRAAMESQNELDGPAFKIKEDPRVTKVGKFIRKTSIDELPQLVNIFKGDMSVVGPRPLPTYETELLNAAQRQRLLAKPGLVCYWQVQGRSDTTFDEWMQMDFDYINQASVWTDLKIILSAIPAVLQGKGAV